MLVVPSINWGTTLKGLSQCPVHSEFSVSGRLFFKINWNIEFLCKVPNIFRPSQVRSETPFSVRYQSPRQPPQTPWQYWSLQVTDSLKFGFILNAPCQPWKAGENERQESHCSPLAFFPSLFKNVNSTKVLLRLLRNWLLCTLGPWLQFGIK